MLGIISAQVGENVNSNVYSKFNVSTTNCVVSSTTNIVNLLQKQIDSTNEHVFFVVIGAFEAPLVGHGGQFESFIQLITISTRNHTKSL